MSNRILIENRIKKLRKYKAYSSEDISDIANKRDIERNLSRLANRGIIRKAGRNLFYRSDNSRPLERELYNHPQDKESLRHQRINPGKHDIFKKLFWSNNSQPIPLSNYISRVLEEDSMCYVRDLVNLFGEREVLKNYLNKFRQKKLYLFSVEKVLDV